METRSGTDLDERLDPLLTRFWEETRLRAQPQAAGDTAVAGAGRAATPEIPSSWAAVSKVLGLGYGERAGAVITKGRALMRARTTPSAGALYPFELLVALRGATAYELYDYEVAGCCLRRIGTVEQGVLDPLVTVPPAPAPQPDAVVAVVGRPWTSMRKYGCRGYLYTHLDGAHAATNIALAAEGAGFLPVTHLRFDRATAAEALGLTGRCREPQALITLTASPKVAPAALGAVANPFAVPVWRYGDGTRREEPGPAEQEAWRSVRSVSTFHRQDDMPRRYGSSRTVADIPQAPAQGPGPLGEPGTPDESGAAAVGLAGADHSRSDGRRAVFAHLALTRASAKGFLPTALGEEAFGHVLAELRQETVTDCADGPRAALRVLVRSVEGIAPGSYAYTPDRHALHPVRGDGGTEEAVVASCMNQAVVRSAALLLVLHAPVGPLLGTRGRQALAELHHHAASAAQRLCLAAAGQRIGITCLGGFDTGLVSRLVGLDGHEEVIYVLACGRPDETAVKWDRAPIAHSHGLGPALHS
ncbi:nitroreductase family protein [Streptomyces sp. NBC_01754]|uniref:nitroreductase family protein n=1 Tax=Streptomyces sp. NBC_01754 TaxID=2975930 RepID=UPI002DD79F91|nr:nitroreductase family protein [Streptomyces sp. NBC_01754]WSC93397.1 nitroreductase family protein [Streptomyces sp. NBC_01754]